MLKTNRFSPTCLLRMLLTVVALTTVTTSLFAQQAPNGNSNKGNIDLKASRVFIFVGKTGFGHEHAITGYLKSGDIHLGRGQNAGTMIFDMSRFTADTNEARRYIGLAGTTDPSTAQQVSQNMLGGYVLNVRKYPTSTFKIDSSLATGKKSRNGNSLYELKGTWELHGVKRPLAFIIEEVEVQGQKHLKGRFAMFQTHFGIKPFSKAFGAIGVTDKLIVNGDIMISK